MSITKDNSTSIIPTWLLEENELRTAAYRKNVDDELFLAQLNEILQHYRPALSDSQSASHPVFLFFGIPRCGKTFFSQLVTQSFDIGFVDNVAARFWQAPEVGLRLSRILGVGQQESTFTSDYGKTQSLGDPHDFHYFWQHWLHIDEFPYDAEKSRPNIRWNDLGGTLQGMSRFWGKPALMKAIDASCHMREVLECYPKAVFIYLQRDYIDSARSLYKGRIDNFGDPDRWYGQAPPPAQFEELKDLPWHEQIAGQLRHLVDLFERQIAAVPEDRLLKIKYYDVCHEPASVLAMLEERSAALGSPLVTKAAVKRPTIRFSSHSTNDRTYELLAAGFEKFNLPLFL